MSWYSSRAGSVADIESLLTELENRLARVSRLARPAARPASAGPRIADRAGDMIATALSEFADRLRGRPRFAGNEASQRGDDALRLGNEALRKLTHEVERRPLMMLAVAVGVGAVAAGLLTRRS